MPMLVAVQARLILLLHLSTRDTVDRIRKLKAADNILDTFDLVVEDLREQDLLTRAWSAEMMSFDWADINSGRFPLSRATALLCIELLQTAHDFMCSAAVQMTHIEEKSHKFDSTSTISFEEPTACFGSIMELHLCLQGTIMGLKKFNALVRRDFHALGSVSDIPLEPVVVPTATIFEHALDALCLIGCNTESRVRTELYCRLSRWRCGRFNAMILKFDNYFDRYKEGQVERERFWLGLFHILYFTGSYPYV